MVYPVAPEMRAASALVLKLKVILSPTAPFTLRLSVQVMTTALAAGSLAVIFTVSTAPTVLVSASVTATAVPSEVAVHLVAASAVKMLAEGVIVRVPPAATSVVGVNFTTRSPPARPVTSDVALAALVQVACVPARTVYPVWPVRAVASALVLMEKVMAPAAPFTLRLSVQVMTTAFWAASLAVIFTVSTAPADLVSASVTATAVPSEVAVHLVAASAVKMLAEGVIVTVPPAATSAQGVNFTTRSPPAWVAPRKPLLLAPVQDTDVAVVVVNPVWPVRATMSALVSKPKVTAPAAGFRRLPVQVATTALAAAQASVSLISTLFFVSATVVDLTTLAVPSQVAVQVVAVVESAANRAAEAVALKVPSAGRAFLVVNFRTRLPVVWVAPR